MSKLGNEEQRDTTEAHKISPTPTATAQRQKKTCKTAEFYVGDMRLVFTTAVGNDPLAVDNQQQSRPRESPAKHNITGHAVDAGGTLRHILRTSLSSVAASFPTGPLQSRLERVCSRGEDSRGPWRLTGSRSLQNGFNAHPALADRASLKRPGAKLLTTPAFN
jgi:hypothetical protein